MATWDAVVAMCKEMEVLPHSLTPAFVAAVTHHMAAEGSAAGAEAGDAQQATHGIAPGQVAALTAASEAVAVADALCSTCGEDATESAAKVLETVVGGLQQLLGAGVERFWTAFTAVKAGTGFPGHLVGTAFKVSTLPCAPVGTVAAGLRLWEALVSQSPPLFPSLWQPHVQSAAFAACCRCLAHPAPGIRLAAAGLFGHLRQADPAVVCHAFDRLWQVAPVAMSPLEEWCSASTAGSVVGALEDSDTKVRMAAVAAVLELVDTADAPACVIDVVVTALVGVANDPVAAVCRAGLNALCVIVRRHVALQSVLSAAHIQDLLAVTQVADVGCRFAAMWLVTAVPRLAPAAVEAVVKALCKGFTGQQAAIQLWCLRLCAEFGRRNPVAVESLLQAATSHALWVTPCGAAVAAAAAGVNTAIEALLPPAAAPFVAALAASAGLSGEQPSGRLPWHLPPSITGGSSAVVAPGVARALAARVSRCVAVLQAEAGLGTAVAGGRWPPPAVTSAACPPEAARLVCASGTQAALDGLSAARHMLHRCLSTHHHAACLQAIVLFRVVLTLANALAQGDAAPRPLPCFARAVAAADESSRTQGLPWPPGIPTPAVAAAWAAGSTDVSTHSLALSAVRGFVVPSVLAAATPLKRKADPEAALLGAELGVDLVAVGDVEHTATASGPVWMLRAAPSEGASLTVAVSVPPEWSPRDLFLVTHCEGAQPLLTPVGGGSSTVVVDVPAAVVAQSTWLCVSLGVLRSDDGSPGDRSGGGVWGGLCVPLEGGPEAPGLRAVTCPPRDAPSSYVLEVSKRIKCFVNV